MKKNILVVVIIVFAAFGSANGQSWQWAKSAGGTSDLSDYGQFICKDNTGNIYVAGLMYVPICYFKTDTFAVNGFNDFFLAKYNASGDELWVKQFGGYNSYLSTTNLSSG